MEMKRTKAEEQWDRDIGEIEVELAKLHDEYGDERLYAALIKYLHRKLGQDLRENALSTDGSTTGEEK